MSMMLTNFAAYWKLTIVFLPIVGLIQCGLPCKDGVNVNAVVSVDTIVCHDYNSYNV